MKSEINEIKNILSNILTIRIINSIINILKQMVYVIGTLTTKLVVINNLFCSHTQLMILSQI